jgi:hypothetical protein
MIKHMMNFSRERPVHEAVRVFPSNPRKTRNAWMGVAVWAVLFAGGRASANEKSVVEKLEHGEVNWTEKTVQATGSGAPNLKLANVAQVRLAAERAAKIDAYRNILETLKGVKITAKTSGANQLEDAQIKTQVEGIIKGCKTVDTRYYSDGGVDVVVKCPLDGGLSTVLAPVNEHKEVNTKGEAKYSGLIIDATGLKAQPALAPKVSADGAEIYTAAMVNPNDLRLHGAAVYTRSVEDAKQNERVGANPLIVKATAVGDLSSDLKISADDAGKLKDQNLTFLAEARVVIATDGP